MHRFLNNYLPATSLVALAVLCSTSCKPKYDEIMPKTAPVTEAVFASGSIDPKDAYMLTSIGQDECDFTVIKAMEKPNARVIAAIRDPWFDIDQLLRFVFSLAGYALWIALYRRETEVRKRRFL